MFFNYVTVNKTGKQMLLVTTPTTAGGNLYKINAAKKSPLERGRVRKVCWQGCAYAIDLPKQNIPLYVVVWCC
jgi:hypothetical protein